MRAPPWMRTPAPTSWRLSASRARLPLVVASDDWEREHAIGAGRPPLHRPLPSWETPSWGPLASPLLMLVRRAPRTKLSLPRLGYALSFPRCIYRLTSRRGSASSRPNTLLHIPSSCRLRMIAGTAQCWQGMAHGNDDFSALEEGRSELLLAMVRPGLGVAGEVAERLTLWEERRFEDLLRRAEEQLLISRRRGKSKQRDDQPDPLARADRARRTAAVGANRKATTDLVSSMLSFEEKEDLAWAKELLPTSSLGGQAHNDPLLEPPPPPPGEDWDRPFTGLHYASLAAPGPTGIRAEHITDMLSVPRRLHANKLHAESASGHPPFQGPAHATVGRQPAGRL